MSKNAEGWIRHRGGKCPVEKGTRVDVRIRNGATGCAQSEHLTWDHYKNDSDIMAYRLHKPAEQVEQVEAEQVMRDCVEKCASTESSGELLYDPIAQGPLQWRDRIAEIDSTTKALTTERAELVQKLASEGFALIGRINGMLTEAAQKHEDVGDPKNWKVGDELIAIGNCGGFSFAGEVVKILVVRDDGGFEVATESEPDYGWFFTEEESITDLKFHSRPSA